MGEDGGGIESDGLMGCGCGSYANEAVYANEAGVVTRHQSATRCSFSMNRICDFIGFHFLFLLIRWVGFQMEPDGTGWNRMAPDGTGWNRMEPDGATQQSKTTQIQPHQDQIIIIIIIIIG